MKESAPIAAEPVYHEWVTDFLAVNARELTIVAGDGWCFYRGCGPWKRGY
jgi:hypothetical protein